MGQGGFPAPCGLLHLQVKRGFKHGGYFSGAMQRTTLFLAHLALALTAGAVGMAAAVAAEERPTLPHEALLDQDKAPLVSIPAHPLQRLSEGGEQILPIFRDQFRLPNPEQVRIEQRVTIRISPRPAPMPLAASLGGDDSDVRAPRVIERKMGKCVPLNSLLGVQSGGGNKLMLFLRGQRLVSATLEKACQGRDYYSGFLVAQHSDGQLCADRDELLARSGAKCKVQGYREIMLAED